jgi:type 1 fimbriae regulatory protein FimB
VFEKSSFCRTKSATCIVLGPFWSDPPHGFFFNSERGKPLSRVTVWLMVKNYSTKAGLSVAAHPHMLRHGCGFALADQGADTRLIQDYLGHRNIQHTVQYTATNPARFGRLWPSER